MDDPQITLEEFFADQPHGLRAKFFLGLASLAVSAVVILIRVTK